MTIGKAARRGHGWFHHLTVGCATPVKKLKKFFEVGLKPVDPGYNDVAQPVVSAKTGALQ
jgi:hypothetical protein